MQSPLLEAGHFPQPSFLARISYSIRTQRPYWLLWLVVFLVVGGVIGAFVPYYISHYKGQKNLQERELVVAYTAAQFLKLFGALVMVPVFRNSWTWLRGTAIGRFLPIDGNVDLHKWIGRLVVLGTTVHVVAWYMYILKTGYQPFISYGDTMLQEFITGNVAFGLLLLMFVTSLDCVKQRHYELFYYTHHLFLPFLVAFGLHGLDFWEWIVGPASLYLIDRFLWPRMTKTYKINSIQAIILPGGVMKLTWRDPVIDFRPAQYLYLRCPGISKLQWHPYTITSAPGEDMSVHVKIYGDWTRALEQYLGPSHTNDYNQIPPHEIAQTSPVLEFQGPYGAPAQSFQDFEHVIFVGAGVGNTPFVSVLRTLRQDLGLGTSSERLKTLRRVHYYAVVHDENTLLWFSDIFASMRIFPRHFLHLHVHMTRVDRDGEVDSDAGSKPMSKSRTSAGTHASLWDAQTTSQLQLGAALNNEEDPPDPKSSCVTPTVHYGRPDLRAVFSRLAKKYSGKRIGVFFLWSARHGFGCEACLCND